MHIYSEDNAITITLSKRSLLLSISGILIIGAIVLVQSPTIGFYNRLLGQPVLAGFQTSITLNDYQMLNAKGQVVSWLDYADKPLYLTTGFTLCPYSCPATMVFYQKLADILEDRAAFALLTIDPNNDKPKVLLHYLGKFNPEFIGLYIKNPDNFKRAIADLKQSVQDIPGKQNIIHSSFIYLLHPKLKGLVIYNRQDLDLFIEDFERISNI